MTSKKYMSLGVEVNVPVPSDVAEFDLNAKRVNACLDEAIDNVVYRSYLADFRNLFCEVVETSTSIARKTKVVKKGDKEVEVWDETEGEYIRGIRATKGWEDDNSALQLIAEAVLTTVNADGKLVLLFDASASERKQTGPKKLAIAYKEAAQRIFTNGNQDKWGTKLGLTYTGDQTKDIEILGWAVKRVEDEKRKAQIEQIYS